MGKNNEKKSKNWIIVVLSFIALIAYLIISEGTESLGKLISIINPVWFACSLLSQFCAIAVEGLIVLIIRRYYQKPAEFSYGMCVSNTMGAQLFGLITPFQSGNLAYQIKRMQDEGMEGGDSAALMLTKNISYQASFVSFIAVLLILKAREFNITPLLWLVIGIGFTCNLFIMIFMMIIPKADRFITKAGVSIVHLLAKVRIIRDPEKKEENLRKQILVLKENMSSIRLSKSGLALIYLLGFVQLVFLYQTCYFTYLAFGLSGSSYFTIISAQAFCTLIQVSMPIPGGLGVADIGFNNILKPIMGNYISYAMVMWRIITFYFPIILGLAAISLSKKKKSFN